MILIPFALAVVLALPQYPTDHLPTRPKPDTVLAKVDGQPITAADVEPYLWDWLSAQATQDLIAYKLVVDDAAKHNVAVTEAEIARQIDQQILKVQESAPAGQDIDTLLHERAMPRSRMYVRTKADLLLTKIAESEFKASDYISTSTFAVQPKSDSGDDLLAALNKAKEAYGRLQKGETWDKVLRAYSADDAVLKGNGVLGWRPLSIFPASTQTEIVQLKVGQYSKPVQTKNGIQIFRVDQLGSAASGATLASLRQQALPGLRKAVYERLMRDSKIERFSTAHG